MKSEDVGAVDCVGFCEPGTSHCFASRKNFIGITHRRCVACLGPMEWSSEGGHADPAPDRELAAMLTALDWWRSGAFEREVPMDCVHRWRFIAARHQGAGVQPCTAPGFTTHQMNEEYVKKLMTQSEWKEEDQDEGMNVHVKATARPKGRVRRRSVSRSRGVAGGVKAEKSDDAEDEEEEAKELSPSIKEVYSKADPEARKKIDRLYPGLAEEAQKADDAPLEAACDLLHEVEQKVVAAARDHNAAQKLIFQRHSQMVEAAHFAVVTAKRLTALHGHLSHCRAHMQKVAEGEASDAPTLPASDIDLLWKDVEKHDDNAAMQAAEASGKAADGDEVTHAAVVLAAKRAGTFLESSRGKLARLDEDEAMEVLKQAAEHAQDALCRSDGTDAVVAKLDKLHLSVVLEAAQDVYMKEGEPEQSLGVDAEAAADVAMDAWQLVDKKDDSFQIPAGRVRDAKAKIEQGSLAKQVRSDVFWIVFANITVWGPQARRFVKRIAADVDCILLQETHVREDTALASMRRLFCQQGHRVVIGPSYVVTYPDQPASNTSGTLASVHRRWSSHTAHEEVAFTHDHFSMQIVPFPDVTVVMASIYLVTGIGLSGRNLEILYDLQVRLRTLGLPFLIAGDWNSAPEDLMDLGWPDQTGATIRGPDSPLTCVCGAGSYIDFVLVSKSLSIAVESVSILHDAPFKPHLACRIAMTARPVQVKIWTWKQCARLPRRAAVEDSSPLNIEQLRGGVDAAMQFFEKQGRLNSSRTRALEAIAPFISKHETPRALILYDEVLRLYTSLECACYLDDTSHVLGPRRIGRGLGPYFHFASPLTREHVLVQRTEHRGTCSALANWYKHLSVLLKLYTKAHDRIEYDLGRASRFASLPATALHGIRGQISQHSLGYPLDGEPSPDDRPLAYDYWNDLTARLRDPETTQTAYLQAERAALRLERRLRREEVSSFP